MILSNAQQRGTEQAYITNSLALHICLYNLTLSNTTEGPEATNTKMLNLGKGQDFAHLIINVLNAKTRHHPI